MRKYVALLRAINVGGNTIIKMEQLRQMFESLRLENVQTYIQSGNVIFESKEEDIDVLEKRIERGLEKAAESKIQLFVRTIRQIRSTAGKSPFTPDAGATVHVSFLNKSPDKQHRQALMAFKSPADEFAIKGREVYNLRRDRDKSVFSNNFIEKVLEVPATTRNLTTIKKIVEKYK